MVPLSLHFPPRQPLFMAHSAPIWLLPTEKQISCYSPTWHPWLQPASMAFPSPGCPYLFPHKLQIVLISVHLLEHSFLPRMPFPTTLSNQPHHFSQPRSSPILPRRVFPVSKAHENLVSKPASGNVVCHTGHAILHHLFCSYLYTPYTFALPLCVNRNTMCDSFLTLSSY